MVVVMSAPSDVRVGVGMSNGLEACEGICEDFYPRMRGECSKGRMNGYPFRSHNISGLVCATGFNIIWLDCVR